jgi:hypothetical protein
MCDRRMSLARDPGYACSVASANKRRVNAMDINLARHVIQSCFGSARELEGLLVLLKEHCTADEYQTYAKAIATAIASIHIEIVNRITSSHPELEAELEASIAKYGRYL